MTDTVAAPIVDLNERHPHVHPIIEHLRYCNRDMVSLASLIGSIAILQGDEQHIGDRQVSLAALKEQFTLAGAAMSAFGEDYLPVKPSEIDALRALNGNCHIAKQIFSAHRDTDDHPLMHFAAEGMKILDRAAANNPYAGKNQFFMPDASTTNAFCTALRTQYNIAWVRHQFEHTLEQGRAAGIEPRTLTLIAEKVLRERAPTAGSMAAAVEQGRLHDFDDVRAM